MQNAPVESGNGDGNNTWFSTNRNHIQLMRGEELRPPLEHLLDGEVWAAVLCHRRLPLCRLRLTNRRRASVFGQSAHDPMACDRFAPTRCLRLPQLCEWGSDSSPSSNSKPTRAVLPASKPLDMNARP